MAKVLVIDDEANLRKVLAALLRRDGYDVTIAEDGEMGLAEFQKNAADAVITDLVMPKLGGMEVLRAINASDPEVPVIIITAHGTVDSAVEAIKLGAFDYVTKPFDQRELSNVLAKAIRTHESARRNARGEHGRPSLVGESPQMQDVLRIIDKVADTPSTVLITGESGTGKELIATALHEGSSRHDKPFIRINCAAIPRDLIESELFGYERGAFTGAVTSKPGRFELADGGTLFLDEIGEMPLDVQAKLLRVLQEGAFEPIGTNTSVKVDARLISASNRPLKNADGEGSFRQDLYYRIKVFELRMPPLRDRLSDLPILVEQFLREFTPLGEPPPNLAPTAWAALQGYSYPGNVRELKHAIQHATILAHGQEIRVHHLPAEFRGKTGALASERVEPLATMMAQFERDYIERTLQLAGDERRKAAEMLGISRKNLWEKIVKHGLR